MQQTRLSKWRQRLWRWVVTLVDVYGGLVVLLLGTRLVIGERWDVIALANMFLHFILLPCIPLALLRLFRRSQGFALLNVIPALFLVGYYGPTFLPHPAQAPEEYEVSVFSYNVRGGYSEERVLPMIDEADADVVLLQDLRAEAATTFPALLEAEYPYQFSSMKGQRGWLTLSRLPLDEPHADQDLGFLRVVVPLGEGSLALYSVHLVSPLTEFYAPDYRLDFETRGHQLDGLVEVADEETMPVLMMGDFNFTEWSEPYGRIAAHYNDAYRMIGWGPGLTRDVGEFPLARIDFAFYGPSLRVMEARTWSYSASSDHRPLFVRLTLN